MTTMEEVDGVEIGVEMVVEMAVEEVNVMAAEEVVNKIKLSKSYRNCTIPLLNKNVTH